jgi:hypothetical protein
VVDDKVHVPLVKLQLSNGFVDIEFGGVDDVHQFKSYDIVYVVPIEAIISFVVL